MAVEAPKVSDVTPADGALEKILTEISVRMAVLEEARTRRDRVLRVCEEHDAARDRSGFPSGSVAHGTTNNPLEDADCGIKVDRRFHEFRVFGPDSDEDRGPEAFIQLFAEFVLPRLRRRHPAAEVDLSGNRAIKFLINEPIEFDNLGVVDPYVELIVGLDRVEEPGIWIPNRRRRGWDPADPELHTELMVARHPQPLRTHRAHVLRLAKRAVKRDGHAPDRIPVMCSWNLSALALEIVTEVLPIGEALERFFRGSSERIAFALTEDPAPAVIEPIGLPEGMTREASSIRLSQMADVIASARSQQSEPGARLELDALFGVEIRAIRDREARAARDAYGSGDRAGAAAILGMPAASRKPTRSHG